MKKQTHNIRNTGKLKVAVQRDVIKIFTVCFLLVAITVSVDKFLNSEQTITLYAKSPDPSMSDNLGQWEKDVALDVKSKVEMDRETKEEEWTEILKEVFGKDYKMAYAISQSECNTTRKEWPNCLNSSPVEHSVGPFQINLAKDHGEGAFVHWSKVPGDTLEEKEKWLSDPYNNALTAKFIYGSSGWYPWSVYLSGVYKEKLKSFE